MKNVSVRYILCFAFLTALTLVLLVWNINAGSVGYRGIFVLCIFVGRRYDGAASS